MAIPYKPPFITHHGSPAWTSSGRQAATAHVVYLGVYIAPSGGPGSPSPHAGWGSMRPISREDAAAVARKHARTPEEQASVVEAIMTGTWRDADSLFFSVASLSS